MGSRTWIQGDKTRRSPVGIIVGLILFAFGLYGVISHAGLGGVTPLLIGASLVYLGLRPGRTALIVFGHNCIVVGCVLFAWGIYHGFCRCVRSGECGAAK